jgi:hypothetical protein
MDVDDFESDDLGVDEDEEAPPKTKSTTAKKAANNRKAPAKASTAKARPAAKGKAKKLVSIASNCQPYLLDP